MSETIRFMLDKVGDKAVRTNLLTVICLCLAVVIVSRRVDKWEAALSRMEAQCWRVSDQREFAHQLKEQNPTLSIPDPVRIVGMRSEIHNQKTEAIDE